MVFVKNQNFIKGGLVTLKETAVATCTVVHAVPPFCIAPCGYTPYTDKAFKILTPLFIFFGKFFGAFSVYQKTTPLSTEFLPVFPIFILSDGRKFKFSFWPFKRGLYGKKEEHGVRKEGELPAKSLFSPLRRSK